MRILVCFKISENLDDVTDKEWNQCLDNEEAPKFLENIIGIYDEAALETALVIKDIVNDKEVELTALTIGGELPDVIARQLFGVGFDKVVHIITDEDIRFCPDMIANVISEYIKKNGPYDVILMGQQSSPGENSCTHIITAYNLDLPCIINVEDVSVCKKLLNVRSHVVGGSVVQQVYAPVVLGIGEALHPYLRVATLRERMAASKKQTESRMIDEYLTGEKENKKKIKLYREKRERKCTWIDGETIEEKMNYLYENVIRKVKMEE